MLKYIKMPCKSHLYLTQSNLSVSNFDVLGTKDTNAALVMLLDSIKTQTKTICIKGLEARAATYDYKLLNEFITKRCTQL